MRKLLFFMLIIVSICTISYAAQMELEYDDEIYIYNGPDVKLVLNGELFTPSEGQMPPVIIQDRTLVPVREVFEKLGGTVDWDGNDRKVTVIFDDKKIELWLDNTSARANNKEIELDVPAKLINSKTMVPVRFISENGGLNVEWDGSTSTVTVSKKQSEIVKIKGFSYEQIDKVECLIVELDSKADFNYFSIKPEDERPFRIILDIKNSKFDFNYETITYENSKLLLQARFGVQEDNVNRIVLDLKEESGYTVLEKETENKIIIALSKDFKLDEVLSSNTDPIVPTEIPVPEQNIDKPDDNNTEPAEIQNNNEDENNKPNDNEQEPEEVIEEPKVEITSNITSVKYSTASEKVRIALDKKFEYELTELENPKQLVLEFKQSALKLDGPSEITLKNNPISTIESSSNEDGTAKVVITMSNNATYDISKKTTELQIKVEQPSYSGVEYINKGTYAEIILSDVDLNALTKLQSKTTKKYTIKYSSSKFNPGSGAIEINDEFVKKINVTSTKITITDAGDIKYTAKQSGDDVVFTLKKQDNDEEKIIILDAGHGGNDPGASNGSYQEKTYNLKVLLKLKDLLEDAGYTVYTTRETDVTLTVNDRVYLASKEYPEASLYVSIHHNSLDNKNYSGTLVMYCARDTSKYGITNKQFATYVLNELVDNLGTVNRGFIEVKETDTSKRVLTEVPMPSILCEIAFISNDDEMTRIKTNSFQNLAAESIFNGIEKALKNMN